MIITYQGENYFKIQAGETAILIDPTNQRSFKGAGLILNTVNPGNTAPPAAGENIFLINHQGEYEFKNVRINGWLLGYDDGTEKTIYKVSLEDIKFAVLGYLIKEPDSKILEHLKDADCLIIPAGGKPWLAVPLAAKLARQIEPSIIIPSLYENLKPFLKEFAKDECEPEEKLVIKKKDLEEKTMTIKCLKR